MLATLAAVLLLAGFGCSKATDKTVPGTSPAGTGQRQAPSPSVTGSGTVTDAEAADPATFGMGEPKDFREELSPEERAALEQRFAASAEEEEPVDPATDDLPNM